MHIITVSVTFLQLKYSFFFMILKKYLLTAFREKLKEKKKDSQKGNKFFWVEPVLGG